MATERHGAAGPLWPLYLLFLLSGMAALIYQVMWARSFGLVFGTTTRAASMVLASFFLGMALGNLLGGRWTRSRAGALRGYGVAEVAIAVGAVAVLLWLAAYRAVYPALYQSPLGSGLPLLSLQMLLAVAAMAPPCVAMGATLPLMSRAVLTHRDQLGRRVVGIYALNTIGATAGALLAGFWLPIWIGTTNAVLLAALSSVGVGLAAFAIARRWRIGPTSIAVDGGSSAVRVRPAEARLALLFAGVSGFGTLALEILYTRLIASAIDSSVHSFALVLATFLVCLALASALAAILVDRVKRPLALAAWAAAGGAVVIMASPLLFGWAWSAMPAPELRTPARYFGWVAAFSLVVLGPGVVIVGLILPTVWKTVREVGDIGSWVGRLTGVNTLAAVAGSLFAGFVLLPRLGVARGVALIALAYGVLGAIGLASERGGSRRLWAAGTLAALAFCWMLQPARLMPLQLGPREQLVSYLEGESGAVAVTRQGEVLILRVNNRYGLGSTAPVDRMTHRSQGRLGLLLHPDPRDVAFIGLATGLSVSAITLFPSVERAVVLEIVPGVLQVVDAFASANLGVLNDPRVAIVIADGRNHLFGTAETFDVVIGDLFIPWHASTGYLYTVEQFEIVRERLNPDGVFVQWLQADQLTLEELRTIVRSFTMAFEHAELWLNDTHPRRPLVALVGRRQPADEAVRRPAHEFDRMHRACRGPELRAWAASAPPNTDDHPIIEFSAALTHLDRPRGELRRTMKPLRAGCRNDPGADRAPDSGPAVQ